MLLARVTQRDFSRERNDLMLNTINIAIDGPAGAGKSTVAKELAKELSFIYVDTGALYRAIGVYILDKGCESTNNQQVIPHIKDIKVELKFQNGMQKIYLNGNDVTDKIREPQISMAASNVSAINEVRAFLLELQRDIAKKNNVIMDGRDIGTVILPDADVKIFLTASAQNRAQRRHLELTQKGHNVNYDELLKEIIQRDHNDSTRTIAPLRPADDAIIVDNSDMDFKQTLDFILKLVRGANQCCTKS